MNKVQARACSCWSLSALWRGWRALVITLGVLLMAGCTAGSDPGGKTATQLPAGAPKVDDLLIVDCLLPGQVRRLGTQLTFITARRAIKTSARDCEIRGGEYVAFDRASYASALKVWLPTAEQGDPAAQTYVGEIFEKGLGVPADYAAAASWYKRAAESGYSRAAINLGNLYEQGLGVPRDSMQALSWYRRAAGLSQLTFEAGGPGETQRLRQEIDALRRELQTKQADLDRVQQELQNLRRSLEQQRSEVDAERGALARLRQELEALRKQGQAATTAKTHALEQSISEGEKRLTAKDREMADLRVSIARSESKSKALRAEIDRFRQQTAGTGPDIQLIEPKLVLAGQTRDILVRPSVGYMALVSAVDRLSVVGRVATEGGLRSLTINGQDAKPDSRGLFKTQIPVKQTEQRVRIVAIDQDGRKSMLEFLILDREVAAAARQDGKIGHPRPERAFGSYYALVIGNNNYRLLPRLQAAENDAKEVARILQKQYGFKVTLLLNATRYDILSALNKLREQLTDKDNLLLYYAGHGELDRVNQRGHWLPVDAEPNSPANWVSNVSITDIFNAMTVRQLLVVADSCYAGTLSRSALGQIEAGMSEEERTKAYAVMAQNRSRMVLTSGGVEPVVDSVDGQHSIFAQAFIELLQANVGVFPGQELFQGLQLRVAAKAQQVGVPQVPEYAPIKFAGHEAGDFFFVRTVN